MSSTTLQAVSISSDFPDAVYAACGRIAPTWPLDMAIAVNPWWQMREQRFSEVAASLQVLKGVDCLMPRDYFLAQWQLTIQPAHLQQAATELHSPLSEQDLVASLHDSRSASPQHLNFSELLDEQLKNPAVTPWQSEIIQQISQFCGLYFQHWEHLHQPDSSPFPFYKSWLKVTRMDKGIEVLTGAKGFLAYFKELPECPRTLCHQVLEAHGSPKSFADYCYALLLDVHGWASWLAYSQWQDKFTEKANTLLEEFVAIRLAWEWVLWRYYADRQPADVAPLETRLQEQFNALPQRVGEQQEKHAALWVWQRAFELSYQLPLQQKLLASVTPIAPIRPLLQAALCIDVRSEPMRRALEAQHPAIETLGFAGFFGLPLEYAPNDKHYRRPQLPGLLQPQVLAKQLGTQQHAAGNGKGVRQQLDSLFEKSPASLGLVEMFGLYKSISLIKNSFFPQEAANPVDALCDTRPFELYENGVALTVSQKTAMAASVLRNMGLTTRFAPVVLLLGHGAQTNNNPHAACYDCGACGGQTGEVNVKVLAQLLNDADVRESLLEHAIHIPHDTHFKAGLHMTTRDEIVIFDTATKEHSTGQEGWQQWLTQASASAQGKRAASLGLNAAKPLSAQYEKRSNDWSETRPEWGLLNNAAFIVGPRAQTRDVDLEGRAFLHDYEWLQDKNFATLELIITAPMIVTNWINLQYYASTVDNRLYGSGNKLLHNVVCDHIGVFEGNGGDLRIGLPLQALHDGSQWRHEALRLSVYIHAPREAIAAIVERHAHVAQLINNDWLYLFQVDKEAGSIARYYQGTWSEVCSESV